MSKPRGCNRSGNLLQRQPWRRIHLGIVDAYGELHMVTIDAVKPFLDL